MDVPSIIRSSLIALFSGVARNLLVTGLTWLVSRKVIDESTSSQVVALLPVAVAAIAWSLVEKFIIAKLHMEKLITALNLPAGSTVEQLKEEMRSK
jgi:nucleoside permease NupC